MPVWASILIALLSGLIGSLITTFYQSYLYNLRTKREVVNDLFAYKYQIMEDGTHTQDSFFTMNSHEFIEALNRVPIVFNKDNDVLKKYDDFWYCISSNNIDSTRKNADLLNLFKALCRASKLKYENWNDDMFTRVFR